MHLPVRDIDLDHIAFFHQADRAAFGRFRRRMSDHQTRRAARKTTVREQRARLTQTLGLLVRRPIQHLEPARTALRAVVADHHHVARHDLVAQDAFHRIVLAFEHERTAREDPMRLVNAGRRRPARRRFPCCGCRPSCGPCPASGTLRPG
ncbi:hypothetical protein G6F65_021340 [Rhizopus arrhizus]|nr:hypothetical protein G6F65_021340 [Rhizopus arrhizus]